MKSRWLLVLLAVVCIVGVASFGVATNASNDDDDTERPVLMKDVPAIVKATILTEILREVDGLELEEIECEKEDGKTVYEAEFEFKGKEVELEIAADGKLLEKEVETEDADQDDADDEDEDDE